MRSPGAKIGLVAALLFVVTSALVWDRVWRDATATPVSAPPPAGSYLRMVHGGDREAGSENRRRKPRGGRAHQQRIPEKKTPQPLPIPKPAREYVVAEGECLSDIARKVYGTWRRWPAIARANGLSDPYLIMTGETLRIP
jgi:nucleoid-associated protein YgaU